MTLCPTIHRLRKQLPSLVLSEQTRLIGRHLQCHEVVELTRDESIALAVCLRYWKERTHTGPAPTNEALALVCREGMRNSYAANLTQARCIELASIAKSLSHAKYSNSYFEGGIQPKLAGPIGRQ